MPSRFAFFSEADHLQERYKVDNVHDVELYKYYNLKPTNRTTGIIVENGKRKLVRLRWGLIGGKKFFKARAESAHETNMFKAALNERRCIIIANGFFEWNKDDDKSIPYYFSLINEESFSIAALYNSYLDEEDQVQKYTTAVLTVDSNKTVGEIFHRMPAILTPNEEEIWLDPNTDTDEAQSLLKPFDDAKMQKWEVNPLPARGDNGPDTIKEASKSASLDDFF